MKKLTRKLFLSVAALAVCATTLVSTTFAWYVSNSEASATAIGGSTADAGGDGNILVAKNSTTEEGKAGAFMQNISFAGDTTNLVVPTTGLNPVTKDGTGFTPNPENTTPTGWHSVDNSVVAEKDAYMTFDIWVLSTKATTVNVELTTTNKTSVIDSMKQTCYNATGAPVAQGETFIIDAVEALRMEIIQDDESLGTFSVKDISKNYTATGFTETTEATDANAYYKALLGVDPLGGKTATDPVDKFQSLTVTENKASKLTFKVWLEGTDSMCFDSCAGQDFEFSFKFTTE